MGGWIRWTIPPRLLRLLEAVLKTGGPLQVWSHVGSTGFILIFAFLMSPYNAFLRFMLRRAAIWEKFSFAQNHSLCWILQSAKTFGMEYGTKILWRGCKESTSGWERQLIPPKRDKICFWYIIEFWKWNMMSRYSARYHQWGRGGKYKCVRPTASLSCSPSTAVLFLEKVEGIGKQEQKRTALYLFLYVFLVSLYLLSLIFFFPFLFSQVGQGLDGASSVGNSRRRRNVQKLWFMFFCFLSNF